MSGLPITPEGTNPSEPSGSVLGPILRSAREAQMLKQSELAKRLGVNAPAISNFEKGARLPAIAQLATFASELRLELRVLILARTLDEARIDDVTRWPPAIREHRCDVLDALRRDVDDARRDAASKAGVKLDHRTFLDWPGAFLPITLVTGDKREDPPKNAGDIGAYSASPIDDRWIHSLGLPPDTQKVSDKEFVVSSHDRLCREYGNHTLLVIGSPASNHLARIINNGCLFRFNLHRQFQSELEGIIQAVRTEKDREVLAIKKRENLSRLKSLMRGFYAYGIVDPLISDVRGFALGPDNDYATVTFAMNPFSAPGDSRHVAVLVAGFHHPGTACALKLLSTTREDKNPFVDHPYGGVLEIQINQGLWEERMQNAKAKFETLPYSQADLLKGLEKMKERPSALMEVNPDDLEMCRRLIQAM